MVIGERFAWAHLRKTGGDATLALFHLFPGLIQTADPSDREDKHAPFADREGEIRGKLLVCNIRRLPEVVLSWTHHVNHWGHKGRRAPMRSPHEMSESTWPDTWLSEMTDGGRFEIGWWLRWENLADDFIEFVSQYTDLTEEKRARIHGQDRVNALRYDHNLAHWFTDDQIGRLYENNPMWALAEREAYEDRRPAERSRPMSPIDAAAP
jgi:hypothetical protein